MNEAGAHPLPMLELRGVGKRYGATVALEDVSLSVPAGEICGCLGKTAPANRRS